MQKSHYLFQHSAVLLIILDMPFPRIEYHADMEQKNTYNKKDS
jgi:hypothetical protein